MYIVRKRGSILISVVLILFLISSLGLFCFKMILYNMKIESMCIFNDDRYSMDAIEEDNMYKFMNDLNYKSNKEERIEHEVTTSQSVKINEDIKESSYDNLNEMIPKQVNSTTEASVKLKDDEQLNNDSNNTIEGIFKESFRKEICNNKLIYDKEKNELWMYSYDGHASYKIRKLDYKFKDNKIILIPTISIRYGDE